MLVVPLSLKNASLIEWAIFYASINLPIIPVYEATQNGSCSCQQDHCASVGKHPRVKSGLKEGTTDLSIIKKWWKKWPNANIGICTGQIGGKIVLDVDPKNGGLASLDSLEEEFGILSTAKVLTGGQGFHFYFSLPAGLLLKNKVNLRAGIDIRGENGYIIAPPSRHASGSHYIWDDGGLENIQEVPKWLIQMCTDRPGRRGLHEASSQLSKHVHSLSAQSSSVCVGEGQRNTFLTSIAGVLCKYGVSSVKLHSSLESINKKCCDPALDLQEVLNISQSISRYQETRELPIEWKQIKEFTSIESSLPSLDRSCLPSVLQEWVVDIATRMQISYEMIAVPALVALGSVIGRKIRIYPKQFDNWIVTPNIWGAIVARPGTFKSPAIAEAITPLEKIVLAETKIYHEALQTWESEKMITHTVIEALKDQLMKAIKQDRMTDADCLKEKIIHAQKTMIQSTPRCKRLKTNDATIEKTVELLIENPNGLFLIRDELSGWLMSLDKSGREGDRAFWLESWASRSSYTVDRIGRGTVHVASLSLSVFGGIQPDKLEALLTNSLESNDDGLLQRFQLLIKPTITSDWENHDVQPNIEAQKIVEKIFQQIHSFNPTNEAGFLGLHFEPNAQKKFNEWRAELEHSLRRGQIANTHYEAHIAKFRSLVPALSLIFEILDEKHEKVEIIEYVSEKSLVLALKWIDYLVEHAKQIYRLDLHPYERSVQSLSRKILANKLQDGDTVRCLRRKCWEDLQSVEQIEHALETLEDHNWLKVVETSSGTGRSTRLIRLHPSLLLTN